MQAINQKATSMENLNSILSHNGPNRHQYKILDDLIKNLEEDGISFDKISDGSKKFDFLSNPSSIIGHVRNRPYGYAGDFELIDRMYTKNISKDYYYWDKYILNCTAAKAVRNRKTYFKKLMLGKLQNGNDVSLLNIASGPARDLKEIYDLMYQSGQLQSTCIDMDSKAIEYAKEVNIGYTHNIDFVNKNIFKYKTEQKHDLVWSAGLFDYFEDKAFVLILKKMKEWVNPKGEIVIGNFNSDHNPSKSVMELLGNWYLYHRTESELIDLACQAGFNKEQISVDREPENINLFLHIKF